MAMQRLLSRGALRAARASALVASPPLVRLPGHRSYLTRADIDTHMARLQRLANTPEPAKMNFLRHSKIVATIGPKIANEQDLQKLMKAGMNVARFNFSHGEYEWFTEVMSMVRRIAAQLGRDDVAIALDTKGPEIRTGQFAQGSAVGNPGFALDIRAGASLVFSTDPALASSGGAESVYIDYADIGATLKAGDPMMVDDGLLEFVVSETGDGWVRATAVNGGSLGERKGVNLPGAETLLPAVSEKDQRDLLFGVEQGVDFVFASFVRKRSHVQELRAALGDAGQHIKIIAKIENLQGVQNFDEILSAADGVMVARGDLGIEIPAPKVFVAQKLMVEKCNLAGKPVICATQMLDSMVTNPRPTRAEVSDVANAVMDGSDAVMLSGETAKGLFPEASISMMAEIVREAEAAMDIEMLERRQQLVMPRPAESIEAVCAAAARTAQDQRASLVMVVTETGEAPALAAKYRPQVPIVAVTCSEIVARQCALLRGVTPILVPWRSSGAQFSTVSVHKVIKEAMRKVRAMHLVENHSRAIVLHDADITDNSEMDDWVMRLVDVDGKD